MRFLKQTVQGVASVAALWGIGAAPSQAELPAPNPPVDQPPALSLPIDCDPGRSCYIQNFVDADPGAGAHDFRCGTLTYDGHKGTDFALPTLAAMASGVAVLAAAPGRVAAVRDGEKDGAYIENPAAIKGLKCGNGLRIDHGRGWQSQYCHLRQGSIHVSLGQRVAAGTPLGLVGQSGAAEFPHLHFALRHDGKVVDPFDPEQQGACPLPPSKSLWRDQLPAYQAGGILGVGFAPSLPSLSSIRRGGTVDTLPALAPNLVLWGYLFGTRQGDVLQLEFAGPAGVVHKKRVVFGKTQALSLRSSGLKRHAARWPTGRYSGQITLLRGARVLAQQSATITIRQ